MAITRVTDDDLTGIPQVKHMLDLALEHGPVMRGDDFVALDNYLNSYRVSGNRDQWRHRSFHRPVAFGHEPT